MVNNKSMLINFVRAIILYLVVLLVTRLMGKREIGQLQPFEFVISLMIANLATIVPIMGLLTMHLIISLLNLKFIRFRYFICGKPKILVYKGKIDEKALEKERFTVNELEERLREKDVFNLGDVDFVILETNGDISVIPKPEKQNVTNEDMNLPGNYNGINYNLILDGVILFDNLKLLGKDQIWLERQVKKFKLKPEDVLVATIDEKGNFFCQARENK